MTHLRRLTRTARAGQKSARGGRATAHRRLRSENVTSRRQPLRSGDRGGTRL